MTKRKLTQIQPVMTAVDGTIIGRMDDLQKQFNNMQSAIDLSQQSSSFIQAATAGYVATRKSVPHPDEQFVQTGSNFSPGMPNLPYEADDQPRQFQYTPGTNLIWTPRVGFGLLSYSMLRELSFASKEIRLNFELVKRTLRGLGHSVTQKELTVDSFGTTFKAIPPNYDEVLNFWKYPDGYHCFDDWVDIILEDALVLGVSSVYKNPDDSLEKSAMPIDASLWRILTDYNGRIPQHPLPAFIQTTYGRPTFWCSRKYLQHSPLHPTVNNPYGYSATEFIVQAVVQSIKRDSSRTLNFTEGNVPAAFVGLPTAWSPSQIQDFTSWFNSLVQGDPGRNSRIMFIPHDGQGIPVSPFSGIDQNATGLDEWLLKTAAWAVGNNPSEFGLTHGTGIGGKGALDAGENAQFRGSTAVYTQYISRLVENISRDYLDAPWVKSTWEGLEPPEDEKKKAEVETARIASGVWSVKYVQDQLGYDRKKYAAETPTTPGQEANAVPGQLDPGKADPKNYQPTGNATVQIPAQFGKIVARAAEADLLAWRDKVRFTLQKGLNLPTFYTDCIPVDLQGQINEGLLTVVDKADVNALFSKAIETIRKNAQEQPIIEVASFENSLDLALQDFEKLLKLEA